MPLKNFKLPMGQKWPYRPLLIYFSLFSVPLLCVCVYVHACNRESLDGKLIASVECAKDLEALPTEILSGIRLQHLSIYSLWSVMLAMHSNWTLMIWSTAYMHHRLYCVSFTVQCTSFTSCDWFCWDGYSFFWTILLHIATRVS